MFGAHRAAGDADRLGPRGAAVARALTPAPGRDLARPAARGAAARRRADRQRLAALDRRRAADQFQPSELAKVALVLYGAHLLATRPKRVRGARGPGADPARDRAGAGADRGAARPRHGDGDQLRGLLPAARRRGEAPHPGAAGRAGRGDRGAAGDRDQPLPAGAPDGLPAPGRRPRRRGLPGHPGLDRARLGRRSSASGSARACRRPSTCPRPTPT